MFFTTLKDSFDLHIGSESIRSMQAINLGIGYTFNILIDSKNEGKNCFLNFELLNISETKTLKMPYIDVNSVFYAKIKCSVPSLCYKETSFIELIQNIKTTKILPLETKEMKLSITILPFLPIQSEHYSLISMVSNAFLPITQRIRILEKDFPLTTWLIKTQEIGHEPNYPYLYSLFPVHRNASKDKKITEMQHVLDFVNCFCEENGFSLYVSESFPRDTFVLKEHADVVVFFPTMGENPLLFDCISTKQFGFYNLISCISEKNGHYSVQVSTNTGKYDISECAIHIMDCPIHTITESGGRTVCLVYVSSEVYEYFRKMPFWPHPVVKNPVVINSKFLELTKKYPSEEKRLTDLFKETEGKKMIFNYNAADLLYSSVPSAVARSKEVFEIAAREPGQIVWRIKLEDEFNPIPFYVEAKEGMKARDICKKVANTEDSVGLIKVRGNIGNYFFAKDEPIQFPIESLAVVDIIDNVDKDNAGKSFGYVLASYAKRVNGSNFIFRYSRPPRLFNVQKLAIREQFYTDKSDENSTILCDTRSEKNLLLKVGIAKPVDSFFYPILVIKK